MPRISQFSSTTRSREQNAQPGLVPGSETPTRSRRRAPTSVGPIFPASRYARFCREFALRFTFPAHTYRPIALNHCRRQHQRLRPGPSHLPRGTLIQQQSPPPNLSFRDFTSSYAISWPYIRLIYRVHSPPHTSTTKRPFNQNPVTSYSRRRLRCAERLLSS